jgi:hypothetical protein
MTDSWFLATAAEMSALVCPTCPLCGGPPLFVLLGCVQAFCGTDNCPAMCWNPSLTAEENLADVQRRGEDYRGS